MRKLVALAMLAGVVLVQSICAAASDAGKIALDSFAEIKQWTAEIRTHCDPKDDDMQSALGKVSRQIHEAIAAYEYRLDKCSQLKLSCLGREKVRALGLKRSKFTAKDIEKAALWISVINSDRCTFAEEAAYGFRMKSILSLLSARAQENPGAISKKCQDLVRQIPRADAFFGRRMLPLARAWRKNTPNQIELIQVFEAIEELKVATNTESQVTTAPSIIF